MIEIVYAALLLNKLKKPINQLSMTKVLKAAGATYKIEDVIKLIDGLQGTSIDKLLKTVFYRPVVEPVVIEAIETKEEEPATLLDLFG